MRPYGTKVAGTLLLGCCLMAASAGCSFQRTGRGFILGSQWSLEYRHVPWLAFRSGDAVLGQDETSIHDQQVADKPELLPWRSRLRERFGSRLFHGRDAAGDSSLTETIMADAANHEPAAFGEAEPPPTHDEIDAPHSIRTLPQSDLPDLAVD